MREETPLPVLGAHRIAQVTPKTCFDCLVYNCCQSQTYFFEGLYIRRENLIASSCWEFLPSTVHPNVVESRGMCRGCNRACFFFYPIFKRQKMFRVSQIGRHSSGKSKWPQRFGWIISIKKFLFSFLTFIKEFQNRLRRKNILPKNIPEKDNTSR